MLMEAGRVSLVIRGLGALLPLVAPLTGAPGTASPDEGVDVEPAGLGTRDDIVNFWSIQPDSLKIVEHLFLVGQ